MKVFKIFSVLLIFFAVLIPATIYVDSSASGTADGSSWANAYTTLQPAIDAALAGDQVWVAAGTYFPTKTLGGTTDRNRTFQMKNDLAIYGGFSGNEDPAGFDLDNRDFSANETILSGDFNQDDSLYITDEWIVNIDNNSENCFHVFNHPASLNLDRTAVLDGFTITGGNTYELDVAEVRAGSAILNDDASPTFQNLLITANNSNSFEIHGEGAIVYNGPGSSPKFDSIEFSKNHCRAMYNLNASPDVTNTSIKNHTNGTAGGGIYNLNSSAILSNIEIESIYSENGGGGICEDNSSSTLNNVSITKGRIKYGGGAGIWIRNNSTTLLNHVTVTQCRAWAGGGIYISGKSTPVITNTEISNNYSAQGCSGIWIEGLGTESELTNVLIAGNHDDNMGSGVAVSDTAHAILNNVTIVNNWCDSWGPGLLLDTDATIDMNNCIIWGNKNSDGYSGMYQLAIENAGDIQAVLDEMDHTCIDTSNPGNNATNTAIANYLAQDSTSIFQNPQFADSLYDPVHPYCLTGISPCVDAGNNDLNSMDYDIRGAGSPRKINGSSGETGTIDIGAYEYQPATDISLPVQLASFKVIANEENNNIIWVTESETNTMGFNIYRSDKESGYYRKINEEFISGAGNSSCRQEYIFVDNRLINNVHYWYKLEDIAYNGETKMHGPVSSPFLQRSHIQDYQLYHNYPNPFNPVTNIRYHLPEDCDVAVTVYDLKGNLIKKLVQQSQKSGTYSLQWDGSREDGVIVPSGVYLLKITTDNYCRTQKMVFVR
jgi:hypothetical protein